jgi:hypothetical protein
MMTTTDKPHIVTAKPPRKAPHKAPVALPWWGYRLCIEQEASGRLAAMDEDDRAWRLTLTSTS